MGARPAGLEVGDVLPGRVSADLAAARRQSPLGAEQTLPALVGAMGDALHLDPEPEGLLDPLLELGRDLTVPVLNDEGHSLADRDGHRTSPATGRERTLLDILQNYLTLLSTHLAPDAHPMKNAHN